MSTNMGADALMGRAVYSGDGERLGTIDDVHEDHAGEVVLVEIVTGWVGTRRHALPTSGLEEMGDDLRVAYTRSQLEGAPTVEAGDVIDYDRERALGGHHGHDVRAWDDASDHWLTGEDLSHGPTPQTRHPDGWVEDGERAVGRPEDATGGSTTSATRPRGRPARRGGRCARRRTSPARRPPSSPGPTVRREPTSAATRTSRGGAACPCGCGCGA
jgi:sporulation protein YlmC with PRC-barrel domain